MTSIEKMHIIHSLLEITPPIDGRPEWRDFVLAVITNIVKDESLSSGFVKKESLRVTDAELTVAKAKPEMFQDGNMHGYGRVNAIRYYKNRTGLGLREAKEVIDKAIVMDHCNFDPEAVIKSI